MAEMTLRDAITQGLREAIQNDPKVFIMGEDIGAYGGPYAVTKGFLDEFGPDKIRDTPISESAIVGAGVGAAMGGERPVVELMTINFSLLAADQIINHAAKMHYMSAGQYQVPLIIRTVTGGGAGLGATHSQSFEGFYASIPGLRVVFPSTPADALGLLRTCFQEPNPILFCEHALLYGARGEVPEDDFQIPLGKARVARTGDAITVVSYGRMAHIALNAAKQLAENGIEAEVIDLRTLSPLDLETVVASVQKTHKCLVLEEAWKTGGFGAYLAQSVQEATFDELDGPVIHIGGKDVPSPYAKNLEDLAIPNEQLVLDVLREQCGL
ncbi:MAG: alpha-ketoacid dehydrogenase subunit beta [SAR202 cluster bacterium]|mgnify:FL=1|nr:alpha-ketoacid dehydrogenase subunit beta [SAR202 cluster bacterium]|tara:strand:+ start:98 stop:1075 length:978 start_codon:yes stop_codon:yes gene_type:complete